MLIRAELLLRLRGRPPSCYWLLTLGTCSQSQSSWGYKPFRSWTQQPGCLCVRLLWDVCVPPLFYVVVTLKVQRVGTTRTEPGSVCSVGFQPAASSRSCSQLPDRHTGAVKTQTVMARTSKTRGTFQTDPLNLKNGGFSEFFISVVSTTPTLSRCSELPSGPLAARLTRLTS